MLIETRLAVVVRGSGFRDALASAQPSSSNHVVNQARQMTSTLGIAESDLG
jgi:hypothetical protein